MKIPFIQLIVFTMFASLPSSQASSLSYTLVAQPSVESGWIGNPETMKFRDFQYKVLIKYDGATHAIGPGCFGTPKRNFKLNGSFSGDETQICFGNFRQLESPGVYKTGWAMCVLEAVNKYAEDCKNVDLDLCIADASIEPTKRGE